MLSLSVLLGPLPLQLCVPCTSPSLKLFLISVVLPSSGSYCILDPRSCHIFHCLVCSFPLLYLPGDLQMQNCSQLLSLTKCLPWSAGLSSPGFFWEMQTMGLHSRQTASPSALNFFLNWCVFSFLFSSRNFLSFFFFFFVGYEACGILVAWPEIKYAPSEAEALDCWGSPIVCIFNKIFTGLICLLKSEKHLPV